MACSCNKGAGAQTKYTVKEPGGKTTTHRTEIEAIAHAKRVGGTVRAAA